MNRFNRHVAVAAAALALLTLAACRRGQRVQSTDAQAGPALPDFLLPSLDGGRLGPADFRGKVVLYDFWATWCTPCHMQAKILEDLFPQISGGDVQFVAISSGEPEDVVRTYVAKHPFAYPVLYDSDDVLSGPLDINALPTLIVADAKGRVVWREVGLVDADTVRAALTRAGAG